MKLLDKDGEYPAFDGSRRIVVPSFNNMWKEWISVIPGIPQNKNSRDRARKLFEKVFEEWWEIMVPEIQRVTTKAYYDGYEEGTEEGRVRAYNSGAEYGERKAKREIRDRFLETMKLDNIPEEETIEEKSESEKEDIPEPPF